MKPAINLRRAIESDPSWAAAPTVSFVTWYPSCRRSDALAEHLGGPSHLIHFFTFKKPLQAPLKYVLQAVVTIDRLRRDRPAVVLVASPPVVAALVVHACSRMFGFRYVIDAHTGVFDDPRWSWLTRVSRFLSRSALATIVTNPELARRVQGWGGRAVVIGDVPVRIPGVPPADLGPGFHVVVINTFSQDEPLGEVMDAARLVPGAHVHITGDPRHSRNRWKGSAPPNVRFTGWLSDEAYAALLKGAGAIVSLTTHDHTMQRGGYEAMAVEKPLVTSDWPLLRETFSRGTIHVDNTARAIAAAIRRAEIAQPALVQEMRQLRRERTAAFHNRIAALRDLIRKE